MRNKFTKAIPIQGPHFKTLPWALKVLLAALQVTMKHFIGALAKSTP